MDLFREYIRQDELTNDFVNHFDIYFFIEFCMLFCMCFYVCFFNISQGKLTFPLCRLCVDTRQQTTCNHRVQGRAFTGTWVTEEVKKSLEKGYEILKIHEIYHFPESRTGLFAPYIDTFLKIKQQASGWPDHCTNDIKKYIDEYRLKEGIELDSSLVNVYPGMRMVAKLCLNSFWGRWGMNEARTNLTYIKEHSKLMQMISDPSVQVTDMYLPNETTAAVHWKYKADFISQTDKTNVFLATFTTAWARLKLYGELEKLGRNVLYFDTDSIIYASDGVNDPPTGPFLGEFTDELDGRVIEIFVSGGPKNYAYKTDDGMTCYKIRGFTLNYINSHLLNFESVKDLVKNMDTLTTITTHNPAKITRDAKRRRVINKPEDKLYRIVYDKRVIVDEHDTLPFGY